jgi:hypothetical protein
MEATWNMARGKRTVLLQVNKHSLLGTAINIFCHNSFHYFLGTSGVITYQHGSNTLAVMWSVPYDYNLYSNWYFASIVVPEHASGDTFHRLYDNYAQPGDGNTRTVTAGGYEVESGMSNSGMSTLLVTVRRA